MRYAPRKLKAFTLVELLVVIGILTILIALLLPALGHARRHAQEVRCAANLRCIGQALIMYTQHYGHYPSCATGGGGGFDFVIWPSRIRSFLGGEQNVFYCPSEDERCEWSKGDASAGPVAGDRESRFGYEPGERVLTDGQYFSYGYNGWGSYTNGPADPYKGLGPSVSLANPGLYRELNAGRVRLPSETIAIADATADAHGDHWISPVPTALGETPGSIHRGGANVLFCDGHVQWYHQNDLKKPTTFGTAEERLRWQANERMWNYDHTFSLF